MALPYRRIPINKCRQKDGNKKSPLDEYHLVIVANKVH